MSNKFVVGGGWSVSQYDLDDLTSFGHVIGINDAAIHLAVHEALTMDRLWFENRWPVLRDSRVGSIWVREKCDCNVLRKDERDRWKTFRHFAKPTPSVTEGELHGGNSGTCGINLAFQNMTEGDNLFLLGFDMQKGPKGEPYWYAPYPWTTPAGATKPGHFDNWVRELAGFADYARLRRLNVYNVNSRSKIDCFVKIQYGQMMEMLNA